MDLKNCSEPLISVIIPVYNTPLSMITDCLNSILSQTYKHFEIIVINDGNNFDFLSCLNKNILSDERLRIINQENSGAAVARNNGIKAALGELICFVDSDDVLTPFFFEQAKESLVKNELDMIIGGFGFFSKKLPKKARIEETRIINKSNKNILLKEIFMNQKENQSYSDTDEVLFSSGMCSRLFSKEILKTVNFRSELIYGEDVIFNLEIINECNRIGILGSTWYYYRYRENSTSTKFNPNSKDEMNKYISQLSMVFTKDYPNFMNIFIFIVLSNITVITRNFVFHELNKSSYKKRYYFLRNFLNQPVWKDVVKNANINDYGLRKRILILLIRYNMYFPIFLFFLIDRKFLKLNT